MAITVTWPNSVPVIYALSTDIVANKLPGVGNIGARVFITDTKVWYLISPDLTLVPYNESTSITGSLANLGTYTTTGLKTSQPVQSGASMVRLNIFGTGTFDVQLQGFMYDGVPYTLPATNSLTGVLVGNDVTTAGIYEFDIGAFVNISLNVVNVTGGNVNAQGGFLL